MQLDVQTILQGGAWTLLVAIILLGGRWAGKMIERAWSRIDLHFDRQEKCWDAIVEAMHRLDLNQAKEHAATRAAVVASARETRHDLRGMMQAAMQRQALDDAEP